MQCLILESPLPGEFDMTARGDSRLILTRERNSDGKERESPDCPERGGPEAS